MEGVSQQPIYVPKVKVIPPGNSSALIFNGSMINRETSNNVLEAFEINFQSFECILRIPCHQ